MIIEPPEIRGQFQPAFKIVTDYFKSIVVPGKRGILFVEDSWDLHAAMISQEEQQLSATAVSWKKMIDYRLWQTEITFSPTLARETVVLGAQEYEYFSGFFDSLEVEHEDKLIEDSGALLILDGSQFHLGMFRDGAEIRSFEWDSAKHTRGLMEQMMRLSANIRRKAKQE